MIAYGECTCYSKVSVRPLTFWRENMEENTLNISKIVIECLKTVGKVDYTDMTSKFECSSQTLLNWRQGKNEPNKGSKALICKGIPELLGNEEQKHKYLVALKKEFSNLGDDIQKGLESCESVEDFLKYLYFHMKKNIETDKIYELFNGSQGKEVLKEIINKKFEINKEKPPIFQMEKLGFKEREIVQTREIAWKLNLENCFILRFKETDKKYSYKVLVNYNFNQEDYEKAGDYTEARDAVKAYGVRMILLFGNANVSDKEINFWMDSNIYMERISIQEISKRKVSKDYVYCTSRTNFEIEAIANQYTDLVIGKLRKYFYVVFKNILFNVTRQITSKQKESRIFWEAKYATRHHINFQEDRIRFLMDKEVIKGNKIALAIGYLSFPCMLRLADKYEKVYLLDNSNTVIKAYDGFVSENMPELSDKVKFITFTSTLSDAITDKYHLYCSIDFILIGTGGGSFIKKIQKYYQICNLWLKNEGVLYISFLNKEFLYEYVDRVTAEENFEFVPNIERKNAIALISNSTEKYELYCETCDCNELKDVAEKYFCLEKMYSYPVASVMEGAHKSKLQNVLKELDKQYSKPGFLAKSFSNCKGYYVDGVLKKNKGAYIQQQLLKDRQEKLNEQLQYDGCYLKTLLLAEKTSFKMSAGGNNLNKIYVIVLPTNKMLPETTNQEICIGAKKLRLLEISEINKLGIEYKNICPFLKSSAGINLNCSYDVELKQKENKYFYIGAGSNNQGYKIQGKKLLKLLEEYGYSGIEV